MTSILPRLRGSGGHRADDKIRELKAELAAVRADLVKALGWQAGTDDAFALLVADRDHHEQRASDAEALVVQLDADLYDTRQALASQTAELLELRAFRDNTLAVSAPAGRRDIDLDDQPTHPTGINVRPLWEALGIGPTTAVTDPAA